MAKTRTDEALAYGQSMMRHAHTHCGQAGLIFLCHQGRLRLAATSPVRMFGGSQEQLVQDQKAPPDLGEVTAGRRCRAFCPARLRSLWADSRIRSSRLIPTGRPDGCFGFAIGGVGTPCGFTHPTPFIHRTAGTSTTGRIALPESRRLGGTEAHSDTGRGTESDWLRARSPENSKASGMPLQGEPAEARRSAHPLWLGGFLHEHGQTEEAVDLLEKSLPTGGELADGIPLGVGSVG